MALPRRSLPVLLLAAGTLPGAARLLGADREVKMFEGVFLPVTFSVNVGDAVTWSWVEGSHRVVSGRSSQDPEAGRLFDVPIDAEHRSFTYLFDVPGDFSFFDRPLEGQTDTGNISVVPFAVEVEVVDLAFTPEEVSIFEGDALEWIWIEGDHTITSGSGSQSPDAGALFDVPSTVERPRFTYAFTKRGVYAYFCRPHEHMGMRATVRVQRRFLRGDLSGDELLDLADAILILGGLFAGWEVRPCLDSADANDDGSVNVTDAVVVLQHLFLGGPLLPTPYPRPGADRSEDGLECW